MKIAYITAGAGGMFCGSCLNDNTLVAALQKLGHDALLIPTYTPIRTDDPDVSSPRVFFGGINVFLQQKLALFRHTPWFLDRLLDGKRLLRWVSRFAVRTRAEDLGPLTLSMLQGTHGRQRKEIAKLLRWLKGEVKPQLVHLTNVLLSGLAETIRTELKVPVLAMLQGDDIFLEALPAADRAAALDLIRANLAHVDGLVASSGYYADFMAGYLGVPRERIVVVHPGLDLRGHTLAERAAANGVPFTIGYFARICPEKGLHHLVDAFCRLKRLPGTPPCRLRVSGWLGDHQKHFLEEQREKLRAHGCLQDFEHVECPDHDSKVRFLREIDVLSVPTVYHEPKGLYVLEAWANGIPVVQPRHGSFPELIEIGGGGVLVEPDDPEHLARTLRDLMERREELVDLGRRGLAAVRDRFHAAAMAEAMVAVYRRHGLGGEANEG